MWAAQRVAQAEARSAALQAQRAQEDADALKILSQLKIGNLQPQQQGAFCGLPNAISTPRLAVPNAQAAGGEAKQPEAVAAAGPPRASGSVGTAAVPGRHRRSASWVKRRASSFDDNSAGSLIAAALGRPMAAHQKSSSHDSVLPAKLQGPERQHSRLSSAAIPGTDMINDSQLQVGACSCLMHGMVSPGGVRALRCVTCCCRTQSAGCRSSPELLLQWCCRTATQGACGMHPCMSTSQRFWWLSF